MKKKAGPEKRKKVVSSDEDDTPHKASATKDKKKQSTSKDNQSSKKLKKVSEQISENPLQRVGSSQNARTSTRTRQSSKQNNKNDSKLNQPTKKATKTASGKTKNKKNKKFEEDDDESSSFEDYVPSEKSESVESESLGSDKESDLNSPPESNRKNAMESDEDSYSDKKKNNNKKRVKKNNSAQAKGSSAQTKKKGASTNNKKKPKNQSEHTLAAEFDESVRKVSVDDLKLPDWLLEHNIKDAQGRKLNDPLYDHTTVSIPEDARKKLSGTKRQYWEVKSKHFDKIVALKMWKFYYVLYNDAITCHRVANLRLSKIFSDTLTVFFHESMLTKVSKQLTDQGYKVVVIEQMEPCNESKTDVMRREVIQIITKGTSTDIDLNEYESKYCLCIFEVENFKFGITYFDATTHDFFLCEFNDDDKRSILRTLIARIHPAEVVYIKEFLSNDTIQMIKGICSSVFTPFRSLYIPKFHFIFAEVFKIFNIPTPGKYAHANEYSLKVLMDLIVESDFSKNSDKLPECLRSLVYSIISLIEKNSASESDESSLPFYPLIQSLYISIAYLDSILLAETVFKFGNFQNYDFNQQKIASLYLDSHALTNLEILEVNMQGKIQSKNSLFYYLDYTTTPYGKRMLKKWITQPSVDIELISARQDAIEDLMNNSDVTDYFLDKVSKFADLERGINKVFNMANKQRLNAVYFENFVEAKLTEFLQLLNKLVHVDGILSVFKDNNATFKSARLTRLTNFKENNGIFPRISKLAQEFLDMLDYDKTKPNDVPLPAKGQDDTYDNLKDRLDKLIESGKQFVEGERKRFGNSSKLNLIYGRFGYEIEIPDNLITSKNKPDEYTLTSKRKDHTRFQNKFLEQMSYDEWRIKEKIRECLIPFAIRIFTKFHQHNSSWRQMISCIGEIDCLCSLSKAVNKMPVKCKPIIHPFTHEINFELKDMVHPCLDNIANGFIPNDVCFNSEKDILIVTGPNMGGKSTLLRMSCLAIILAQVGCWVPAVSFEYSLIDRIFTRIGASDRILEGKSTFFVEMEETFCITDNATKNSFAIIDELGRGTSTYDGVAIAYAVLKHMAEKIRCKTLFATHYHMLVEECKLYKNIDFFKMDCEITSSKDIVFKYKFIRGLVAKSFGIKVAQLAGIPQEVTEIAEKQSSSMYTEKMHVENADLINKIYNEIIMDYLKIQTICMITKKQGFFVVDF